jgi:hypothetical protein
MKKKSFKGIFCLNFIQGAKILAVFPNQTNFWSEVINGVQKPLLELSKYAKPVGNNLNPFGASTLLLNENLVQVEGAVTTE